VACAKDVEAPTRLPPSSSIIGIPRTREFAISTDGVYRPWEKVAKELAKCLMLCSNCHAEVHAGFRVLNERVLSAGPEVAPAVGPAVA
jgi:hypothetical protein